MNIATSLPPRLGRYEIVGRLAMGGMAEILLGRITGPSGFERPVVIKRILPHLHRLPELVHMFLDEGRIAARIGHPNVAQVQEMTGEAEGELFLVMEYLEGEASSALGRRARARGGKLDPALCAYIAAEACAGLHAAHELRASDGAPLGVVHRDVSPQNLFIGYDGTVKVLDFGIAKAAERITTTEAGTLKGKFAYMSPEQAGGRPLDRRSDLFSLGIVLYELSTQRRLFKRSSQTETLRAVLEDPIVPPSSLDPSYPPALERICLKALARDTSERFQSAQDMRRDLLQALRELGPSMPEEALAELMRGLFPDRIEAKREMVSKVREGLTPSHVPAADIVEEDLPTVEAEARSLIQARGTRTGASRRYGAVAAAVAALVVATTGLVYARTTRRDAPHAPRETHASVEREAPPTAEPTTERAREFVEIAIDSDPSGAHLTVDAVARGTTPATLRFEPSRRPTEIVLTHDGYEPLVELIPTDVNRQVRLSMTAAPEGEPATTREERARAPRLPRSSADDRQGVQTSRERAFRRFR